MATAEGSPPRPRGHPQDLRTFQKLPHDVLCRVLEKVQEGDLELESDYELVRWTPRDVACNRMMRVRQVSRAFRAAADSSTQAFWLSNPSPGNAAFCPSLPTLGAAPDPDWYSRVGQLLSTLVPRWPNLTTLFLGLRYRRQDLPGALAILATACPQLQHLHLDARFSNIPPQELPALGVNPLLGPIASLPHLSSLNLYGFRWYRHWWAGFPTLPQLEELLLVDCGSFEVTLPPHVSLMRLCRNGPKKAPPCLLHLAPSTALRELRLNCVLTIRSLNLPPTLEVLSLDTVVIRERSDFSTQLPKLAKLELINVKLDTLAWLTTFARTRLTSLTSLRLDQVINLIREGTCRINFQELPALLSLEIWRCDSWGTVPPLPETLQTLLLDDFPVADPSRLDTAPGLQKLKVKDAPFKRGSVLSNLTDLEMLELEYVDIMELPRLDALVFLQSLFLSHCKELVHVKLPRTHGSLTHVELDGLVALASFQASPALRHLVIRKGPRLPPLNFKEYPSLEDLTLSADWVDLPDLTHLTSPKRLALSCRKGVPSLGHLGALEVLEISGSFKGSLPESLYLSTIPRLRKLSIRTLRGSVFRLGHQPELQEVTVCGCFDLEVMDAGSNPKLQKLKVCWCRELREVDLTSTPFVTDLTLEFCALLTVVKGLQGLSPLATLDINHCGVEKDELMRSS